MIFYTVRRGDTLRGIARQFRVSAETLTELNGLHRPDALTVGQGLLIPMRAVRSPAHSRGCAALCFCPEPDAPTTALSTLSPTWVSAFSCYIGPGGELLPSRCPVQTLPGGNGRLVTVRNLSESGSFSGRAIHPVLADAELQEAFLQGLLTLLDRSALCGAMLELAYVLPFDREALQRFLFRLSEELHGHGYLFFTVLPPKTSAEQVSLADAAICPADYGHAADFVILRSAGNTLPDLQKTLDYGVSQIPHGKILLEHPACGLRQPCSAERLRRTERTLRLAAEYGLAGFCFRDADCLRPPFSMLLRGLFDVESAHI